MLGTINIIETFLLKQDVFGAILKFWILFLLKEG